MNKIIILSLFIFARTFAVSYPGYRWSPGDPAWACGGTWSDDCPTATDWWCHTYSPNGFTEAG